MEGKKVGNCSSSPTTPNLNALRTPGFCETQAGTWVLIPPPVTCVDVSEDLRSPGPALIILRPVPMM